MIAIISKFVAAIPPCLRYNCRLAFLSRWQGKWWLDLRTSCLQRSALWWNAISDRRRSTPPTAPLKAILVWALLVIRAVIMLRTVCGTIVKPQKQSKRPLFPCHCQVHLLFRHPSPHLHLCILLLHPRNSPLLCRHNPHFHEVALATLAILLPRWLTLVVWLSPCNFK